MMNITLKAYDYLDELRSNPMYVELIKLNKFINTSNSEIIKNFKKDKEKYESVLEYGKYHPDFKTISKTFSISKAKLYEMKEVKRYFELINYFEEKIRTLLKNVASSISNNIPIENEFGMTSLGGSCSGCK